MKLPQNVSESVKRRNPELYGPAPVAPVEAPVRKPDPKPALVKDAPKQQGGKRCLVAIVTLISCRHRLLDDDNSVGGFKPLRDAIAASIGTDDGDPRVRWEYGQVRCEGEQGTIVKIERLQ